MERKNYYVEKDYHKILNLLESILLEEKDVVILQKDQKGEKYLHSCKLAYFSGMKNYLRIRSQGDEIKIKQDCDIFIHSSDFDLVFKASNLHITSREIEMQIPEEVRVKEHRKKGRFVFPRIDSDDDLTAYIAPEKSEQYIIEGSYKVLDLSIQGIGLYLPQEKAKDIHVGDKVRFKRILVKNLEEELTATVKNKLEIFPNCRIGFEFEGELNPFDFQSLISLYA